MHDRSPNGHPSWAPPSPWDMLLGRLDRIDQHMMGVSSRLGGLEQGQEISLDNDREIFGAMRTLSDRVMTLEVARTQPAATPGPLTAPALPPAPLTPPPTAAPIPPPTAAVGLLSSITDLIRALTEVLPRAREVVVALLLLAAALGIAETKTAPGSAPAPAGPSSENSFAP
jgi:hypothetical protein